MGFRLDIYNQPPVYGTSQVAFVVKNLPSSAGDVRAWQPTPVLVPEESHGQRSLVGYSPWGCKSQTRLKQLSTIPNMRRVLQYILNETVGKIYAVELHSLFIIKI